MSERGVHMAAVKSFVERWQKEKGNEKSQARSFWIELLQEVLGFESPTKMLDFEKRVREREIDVYCEEYGVLIEHKSRGVNLFEPIYHGPKYGMETAYEQACWYQSYMSRKPRWIITCNFDSFYIYDVHSGDSIPYEKDYIAKIALEDLPESSYVFEQIFDPKTTRLAIETNISVKTTELIRKMYDALMKQYKNIETDKKEQHDLNVLIVRLVFLLYAENAEILQEGRAFYKYLQPYIKLGKECGGDYLQNALINLFKILDTKVEERGYISKDLENFPYINGGLFSEEIIIPQFTEEITDILEKASTKYNWKDISPTIFGATFESTLNPETRRKGGMHYTSIENIHKVIDPLFLDDLKKELACIEATKVQKSRIRDLKQFIKKLSQLTFLDPACGSGNFLTETYICLRNLENLALRALVYEDKDYKNYTNRMIFLGDAAWQYGQNVSINQFYGIEINDFAVAVAKTALWIAEIQANAQTEELLDFNLHVFPLANNQNVIVANALRMDWNTLIPNTKLSYIISNPPFVGFKYATPEQKYDMKLVFKGAIKPALLDYVCCWYKKAADYMRETHVETSFVSTNSVSQGQMAGDLWSYLLDKCKVTINFAWPSFVWESESSQKAHVHVVVIGFSYVSRESKYLYCGDTCKVVRTISPYLTDAANIIITSREKPLCQVPEMVMGNQAMDGGNLLIKEEDYADFIAQEPKAVPYIKRYMMGNEFIKNKYRYCLWLVNCPPNELRAMPHVMKRVNAVRKMRLASSDPGAQRKADTPMLFREARNPEHFVAIPITSSEQRSYVPIGFLDSSTIPGNTLFIIPDATLFHFGVLTSSIHMDWMRTVGARLEMRYRYSKDVVYNNFPWPTPTEAQKDKISRTAQAILDARAQYPDLSLAKLYEEDKMPSELRKAHKQNDLAVMEAYGFNAKTMNEADVVAALMQMYKKLTDAQETK